MKKQFEESGEILEVDLLAAFVALWRSGTPAAVRFSRPAASAGFDLADGEVVASFSSDPRFETSAILLRAGKLEAAALERLSIPPGGDAAVAALQAGILTRREWKWGEKIRAIEILADLLGWTEGRYILDPTARPAAGEFTVAIPRLILELFLRSRDRSLIEHQLGEPDLPLARSSDFDELFPTFGLTADAESVVRLIDGRRTAALIQQTAPADEFAVAKLLAALATLGLVRTTEPQAADAVSPDAPSRPEPAVPGIAGWPEGGPTVEEVAVPESEPQNAALPLEIEPEAATEAAGFSHDAAADSFDSELPGPQPPPESAEQLLSSWNAPEEPSPEVFTPEPQLPPLETVPPPRRAGVPLAVALLVLLAAGILGVVLLRSRSVSQPAAPGPAALAVSTPPARAASEATAPPVTIPPAETASVPASSPARERAAIARRPTVPAAPPRATPVETAAAGKPGSAAREEWLRRARRDRTRFASDRRARYAIQLELACEVPSLEAAWKHDRPAGSMWLLPATHQGRECFKVLWGRYPTLQAARSAKPHIPGFFTTGSNHPAVVAIR